jgi:dTDP-4-dehydrorhamnose 3,5-epimerase
MKVTDTDLPGVLVIEPRVFEDERGEFFESWNQPRWAERGLAVSFAQSNISRSWRGVLRGLHYQWPQPQGKLVSVLEGEVYDVAVDIRRGSPDFGRATAAVLSAGNRRQMWIPEGFAHGFVVLSESAVFHYLCTAPYSREVDLGIRWNDERLAIDWPNSAPILSDKDQRLPFLEEVPNECLPEFVP